MLALRVVPPVPPEVTALNQLCNELATQNSLGRFEIAVKQRLTTGITNDNELRSTDDLLVNVMRGADAVETATRPTVSELHARHKAALAVAKEWSDRWLALANPLKSLILKYRRDKEDLARRQQRELEIAADNERKRKEAEARAALRSGNMAAFQEAQQEAQMIVTPIIAQATPVLENSSVRKPWQVEITNPMALVKLIAAGIVPLSAIKEWDITFLKKEVTKRGGLPVEWAPAMAAKQEDRLSVSRR